MIIIGHRGAGGEAPENTLAGIDHARHVGVDVIELDVRRTKDEHFVVFHDKSLNRITGKISNVSDMTLAEIQSLKTRSGEPIPSLGQALKHAKSTPVMLDLYDDDWAQMLASELKKLPKKKVSVSSSNHRELAVFGKLMPSVKTYASEMTKPISAVYNANLIEAKGISLYFWVLNPFTYHYAKRSNIEILVYTVNSPLLARFIRFVYPKVSIITDYPSKIISELNGKKAK